MINVTENKQKYIANINRENDLLAVGFANKLKPILGRQWLDAAKSVKNGDLLGIDTAVDDQKERMVNFLLGQFRRIASTTFRELLERVADLGLKEDVDSLFWSTYNKWVLKYGADHVTKINNTTKNLINMVVVKAIGDGKSYEEAAREINKAREISNLARSRKIARTEIHTARSEIVFNSVKASGVDLKTKEWITAGDERVRVSPPSEFDHTIADGETVPVNEFFIATGENLMYPGDSAGSPGNIIDCRCQALYNT